MLTGFNQPLGFVQGCGGDQNYVLLFGRWIEEVARHGTKFIISCEVVPSYKKASFALGVDRADVHQPLQPGVNLIVDVRSLVGLEQSTSRPVVIHWSGSVQSAADGGAHATGHVALSPAYGGAPPTSRVVATSAN